MRIKDVADVAVGQELRTGSASVNGREAVLGTALMLIGGNSRSVAAAAEAKIKDINRTLPPGIEARTVLNRTQLVDATIKTVATNLAEGALLVIFVLFVLLGNFRAALITALVIPVTMLITAAGMLQGRISANLMSLGALDFGLIVDGAVIIAENSLRHLAERHRALQRPLSLDERLETVTVSAKEMIQPTVYGQLIIILVYVPLLTFSGVEGKTFTPMALTVVIALAAAFVLSLTFVPAMIAIAITAPRAGTAELARPHHEPALSARARRGDPQTGADDRCRRIAVRRRPAALPAPGPGVHTNSRRKEHRHGGEAHSQHGPVAIANACSSTSSERSADFRRSPWSSRARARPISPPIRCRPMLRTPTSCSSRSMNGRIRTCPRTS